MYYPGRYSSLFRTDLTNGVTVWCDADPDGKIVLHFPDGRMMRTCAAQLDLSQAAVKSLREAYEYLLGLAGGEMAGAAVPVDALLRMDDLLFALDSTPVERYPNSAIA